MKRPLSLRVLGMLLLLVPEVVVAQIQQYDGTDTTIFLNQVTVYDVEDPALALVKRLREEYKLWNEQQPLSLRRYSRQFEAQSGRVDFEVVARVELAERPIYQEVEAYRTFEADRADFGNQVQIGAQSNFSYNPNEDFSGNKNQSILGQFPLLAWEQIDWTPLETQSLDRWSRLPVGGLLAFGSGTRYEFALSNERSFNGVQYVDLHFSPKGGGGWQGRMVVNTTTYRIEEIWATLSEELAYAEGLEVHQKFAQEGLWYTKELELRWGKEDVQVLESRVLEINMTTSTAERRPKMMVGAIPESRTMDASFWEAYRPPSEEVDAWTRKQDSLIRYLNSDAYLDSADAVYNKFHWYEPFVSGIGYRKRSKGQQFYYSPLISQWNFLGIGGTRWIPAFIVSQRFQNDRSISLTGTANYGFKNQDLRGTLSTQYTYNPLRNASVEVRVGDNYQQITQSVDLTGLFARSNFIQKTFIEGYHRYEWFNGFYTRLGAEYSKRQSIDSLELAQWSTELFGDLNQPEPFETYTVAQLSAEFLIRPYQRYYLKGRQKIVLASRWPDFYFTIWQGIPNLLGSDVRFTKYEFRVEDMFRFGAPGTMHYRLVSGGFLNDPSTVRFIEYKWFRGGDFFLFTNPIYTHQTLDGTFASPGVYLQGHAMHHFDGALLGRIPGVRRLKLGLAVGGSTLILPEQDVYFGELFLGLERKIRMWDATTRWGGYYTALPQQGPGFRFKVGVDFLDTFNDRWNY